MQNTDPIDRRRLAISLATWLAMVGAGAAAAFFTSPLQACFAVPAAMVATAWLSVPFAKPLHRGSAHFICWAALITIATAYLLIVR